jgi:hypothetical protein
MRWTPRSTRSCSATGCSAWSSSATAAAPARGPRCSRWGAPAWHARCLPRAPTGLLERAQLLGRSRDGRTDTTGSTQFYDPLDHVGGVVRDPARRIVLIGNREDRNTPFALQQRFADALAKAGHRAELRTHAAEPPEFHDLTDRVALLTASQCAREAMFQ